MNKRAIYPGSFDPVTLGHLNMIRRAAAIFDELIVCVCINSGKPSGLFTPDERVKLLEKVTEKIPNVKVECCRELVANYAKKRRAQVLVRGLRAVSDYEVESQLAMTNAQINPELETVFLHTDPQYAYLSSSVVKEMAQYGADLSGCLPWSIIGDVEKKYVKGPPKP